VRAYMRMTDDKCISVQTVNRKTWREETNSGDRIVDGRIIFKWV
jgi:hypothetical protein